MNNNTIYLSVLVPCYNESEGIVNCSNMICKELDKLDKQLSGYELIFIDDGSTDNTFKQLYQLAQNNGKIKYISFSRNFGKEAAMLAGLEHCIGDCAVIMDADLQHPPSLIVEMLTQYFAGYDQVIAKRNRKGDAKSNILFAKMYYKLANKILDVKMIDGAGDFRLLSRKAIDALISLKENNRFSKGLFSWIGFRQTYIAYENQARIIGQSKWSFSKLLQYGIDGVISFNSKPLRVCIYLGGILLGISSLYLIYLLVSICLNGIDAPGYFTTILIITMFSSVQLLSIGIMGEYIGRIYHEVKKRPSYLISQTNLENNTKVPDEVNHRGDEVNHRGD